MSDPLAYLGETAYRLAQGGDLSAAASCWSRRARPSESRFDGHEVNNLASNNYLGLTTHPKLREAALAAAGKILAELRSTNP